MRNHPGEVYPDVGTVLDLIPASRGDTFTCWTEAVDDGDLVVSAPLDEARLPLDVPVGEHVHIVWKGAAELQGLPCTVIRVESGERPRWHLRAAGVVTRGQRRDAVRAPLTVPVRLGPDPAQVGGTTVDLSEGGLRCVLEKGARLPHGVGVVRGALPGEVGEESGPSVGDVVRVSVVLSDATVTCLAEITRLHPREDARVELSVRFIGLSEHQQDELRRRVFARLRDLRHRGLI